MPKKLTEGISRAIDSQYKKFVKTLSSNAIDAHIGGDVAAHKIMNIEVNWDQVDKEAVKYAGNYGRKLSMSGKISIPKTKIKNGVEVFAGYEDYDLIGRNKITDKKEISRIIREGLKEGKPTGYKQEKNGYYPEGSIAYELDKYFNARKSHASLVARTEIARIEGVAMKNRYKQTGYNFAEWNTMGDDDVRESHQEREAHGIYPIDDIPDIGEPNCRCVIIPVTDEKARAAGFDVEEDIQPDTTTEIIITQDFKNIKDAQKEYTETLRLKFCNLKGIGLDVASEINNGNKAIIDNFKGYNSGDILDGIKSSSAKSIRGALMLAHLAKPTKGKERYLTINSKYFGSLDEANEVIKYQQDKMFYPAEYSVGHVIVHEHAHQIQYQLVAKEIGTNINPEISIEEWNSLARTIQKHTVIRQILDTAYDVIGVTSNQQKREIRETYGEYAFSNAAEFHAQVIADSLMSEDPSEFSKAVLKETQNRWNK